MPTLLAARNAVALSFVLNGLFFATLTSRLPTVRQALGLSNGSLGLLLLAGSAASVLALTTSGRVITRFGATRAVRGGTVLCLAGLVLVAVGAAALGSVAVTALGLVAYGAGVSVWDVAMNLEGAEVERRLARNIMPRFHGAWSVGSIGGAGLGIPMTAWDVPMVLHLSVVSAVAAALAAWSSRAFLPATAEPDEDGTRPVSAWLEPRTLMIGVMVLAFAVVEGTAFDWLAIAFIDGYDVAHWVGTLAFSVFVTSMFAGRLVGPVVLDRIGRAATLWLCCGAALVGSLLTVLGGSLPVALVGVVVWGLGASLGFPVGLSTAADDPARAAARVSVVSTIGYGAFLAGPPLLGWIGDRVGTLDSLLVVAALMVPAAFAVLAARPGRGPGAPLPPAKLEM